MRMGINGRKGVSDAGSIALATLLFATGARGEDQSAPAPDSSKVREFVFTSTNPEAELQGYYPTGWRVVCVGSCRTQAFVGATYRLTGRGVPASKEFTIPDASDAYSVRGAAGSTAKQVAGATMIGVGAATLPAAYILLMVSACSGDCAGADEAERDMAASAREAILPVFFGGLAVTAVGVALFRAGGTSVDTSSGGQERATRVRLGRGVELTPTGFVF
jgi:hypothetical protein